MSKITKYMQMNNQILVAYEYNKWNSIQQYLSSGTTRDDDMDYPLVNHTPVVVWQSYRDSGGIRWYENPMMVDTYMDRDINGCIFNNYVSKNKRYNMGISSVAFSNYQGNEYFRLGILDEHNNNISDQGIITANDYKEIFDKLLEKRDTDTASQDSWIQKYLKDSEGNPVFFGLNTGNQDGMFYDKIRVFILSGYVFNMLEGFHLKVKAKQRPKVYNIYGDDYKDNLEQWSTLLSFVFNKSEMRNVVKWLDQPFYMSSRFYDRYIDIYIPSAFYLASKLEQMSYNKSRNVTEFLERWKGEGKKRTDAFLTINSEGYQVVDSRADYGWVPEIDSIEMLASIMNISINTDLAFEFSPITSDNYNETIDKRDQLLHSLYFNQDSPVNYFEKENTFILDHTAQGFIKPISNSDYFNCKILQDPETGTIYYSPRFGVANEFTGDIPLLTKPIMDRINTGLINMYNYGIYDNDYENIDEFEDTYGDQASKWVVLNELVVTYNYIDNYGNISKRSSTYTNTIDYAQDTDEMSYVASLSEAERFGVTSYRPIIKEIAGHDCISMTFVYNAHLINRVNGAEVIRTASLAVTDMSLYTELPRKLNIDNLQTWRVFNKIDAGNTVTMNNLTLTPSKEYVRSYYNAAQLVMNDSNNTYTQGKYNLRLFASGHNYKFMIMESSQNTTEIFHTSFSSLNGQYILIFFLNDGTKVELTPTFSDNMNLALGELEYKVSDSNAALILSKQGNNPIFTIVCRTSEGDTTIYQGTFGSY